MFHWTYLSLNSPLNIFSAYSALSCLKAQCKPINLHANCVTNQTTSKKAFHLLAHQPPPVTPLSVSIPNTDYEVTASTCVCAVLFFFKEIKLKHNSPTLAPQIKPQTYIHEAKEKRPQFSTSHPVPGPHKIK